MGSVPGFPFRILLVEENGPDRMTLREMLRSQSRFRWESEEASMLSSALELSTRNPYSAVLLNLKLPDSSGLETLGAFRKACPNVPLVALCDLEDEKIGIEAAERGAQDYLVKGSFDAHLLSRSLFYSIHRNRVEERLTKFSRAVEQSPAAVVITDIDGQIEYVNPRFSLLTGYTAEEALGKNPRLLKSGHHPESFYRNLWTTLLQGNDWRGDFCNRKKNGDLYWESSSISPIRDREGSITHFVAVKEDITENRNAQAELKAAHHKNEAILESISSILIGVDTDGRVTQWNKVAETIFGIPADRVVGLPLQESGIDPDGSFLKGWLGSDRGIDGPVRLDEILYRSPEGKDRVLGFTLNPLRRGQERAQEFLLLGADVTDQKHLQAQLIHAQKLEAIGQLAAGIAHEINTPTQYVGDNTRFLKDSFGDLLGIIIAYKSLAACAKMGEPIGEALERAQELEKEADLEYLLEEIPRAVDQSLDGLGRIAKIVRAMKEFSHPGTEDKTPIDLNKSLENTLTVARNEWKYVAEMETDFDPDLPLVPCLPGEINQVALNLVVNAAHAIAGRADSEKGEKGMITVATRRVGDQVEVRISDTGGGIPQAILNRIFEPFFTTKEVGKGTGQGLAIAHSVIVDKHGGAIEVETEVGQGTTFILRLPLGETAPKEVAS